MSNPEFAGSGEVHVHANNFTGVYIRSPSLAIFEALKRCTPEVDSSQGCDPPVAGEETGPVRKDDFHFVTRSIYHDAHAKSVVVDHIVILK